MENFQKKMESGVPSLFRDANFSELNFTSLRQNMHAVSKHILTVREYTLGIPERESTSTEKLSRGLASKKTEFRPEVLSMQIFFLI